MTEEELTQETIDNANKILSFLISRSHDDWRQVMEDKLEGKEFETNHTNVAKKLKKFHLDEPVGAVAAGTGVIKQEVGIEGEAGQKAINALKEAGRLLQCGRGRGKCLIVLSSNAILDLPKLAEPTEVPEEVKDQAPQEETPEPVGQVEASSDDMIEANNVSALTRAIRDNYRNMSKRVNELTRRCKTLEKQNAAYEQQIDEHVATIANLESQLEQQKVGSWG